MKLTTLLARLHGSGGDRGRRSWHFARTRGECEKRDRVPPHRDHLSGEPQLRQSVRPVGQHRRPDGQRGFPTPTAAHDTDAAGQRDALLYQLDVNLTSPPLDADLQRQRGLGADHQPLHQRPVSASTTTSRRIRRTCPAPGQFATNGILSGQGPARRLHARHRASLLQRAVPDRRRQAGPLHDRQRCVGPDHGQLQHPLASHLLLSAFHRRAALRRDGQLLPGRVRWLVPQSSVAGRGPRPPFFANAAHDGGSTDLQFDRRRQRHGDCHAALRPDHDRQGQPAHRRMRDAEGPFTQPSPAATMR